MITILHKKITTAVLCAAAFASALFSCTDGGVTQREQVETNTINTEQEETVMITKAIKEKTPGVVCPPDKPGYYGALAEALKREYGAAVNEITWDNLKGALDKTKNELIILTGAAAVPYDCAAAIDSYLKSGGKLLTLGGPPLTQLSYPDGGGWKSRDEILGDASKSADRRTLFDFDIPSHAKNWARATNDPGSGRSIQTLESSGPDGGSCLYVVLDNFTNWDNISKPVKIPEGVNSIGFYVRGGPATTAMCLEIAEKDGSRWIASFPVSENWKYTVLTSSDFQYWHDNQSTGRGGVGDTVVLSNAGAFSIGLALSHVNVPAGRHEYWLSNIYAQIFDAPEAVPALVIEGLSPEWKFYPITSGRSAAAFDNQIIVGARDYTMPAELFSLSPRPQGTGFGRGRERRFIPLIEVYDAKNLRSGFLAWMFVNKNNITAGFGTSDPAFYDENGIAAVLETARAMLEGVFFTEAGAEEYIYVDSETESITLGANITGALAANLTLELGLYTGGVNILNREYDISGTAVKDLYDLSAGRPDRVTAALKKDGRVVDKISHEIVFWSPKPESERSYITVSGNEFMRGGEPLRLYGVNYMPSSGIAANPEDHQYFEHYVSSESYDPDVFYKDLLRVKEVGFNAVSLFVYHQTAMQTKNMLHLIDMCDKLDLIVDLSIRPRADPFDLAEHEVTEMIQALHIAELDNVCAYDIAWERTFGSYEPTYGNAAGRKSYDGLWERWVKDNYGSIENAEAVWGCAIPRAGGAVASPPDDMYNADGRHTVMMAAYRRFTDDLVSYRHGYAKDLIGACDPNHLVSARTISTSGIPLWTPGFDTGYDFMSLAPALDFMSPECWGITPETADQGIFTAAYARYAKPGAPVVWKEFGHHIWTGSNFDLPASRSAQQIQAENYSAIIDMAVAGYSNGIFCWWWPGGYRTNENSDYGVVNPDGSDRLVTGVIREYRDKFLRRPKLGEPGVFFEVDRDKSATGTFAMYSEIKDEFLGSVSSGNAAALTDASTGTDTATVPGAAIGGAGEAGPDNPARYVNGLFRAVYIKSDGDWKRINYGDKIKLKSGPVEIKAVMCNTLGSEWLSEEMSEAAYVSIVSTDKSDIAFKLPLSGNVKHLETHAQEFVLCDGFDGEAVIAFRFGIEGRFLFGSTFMFTAAYI